MKPLTGFSLFFWFFIHFKVPLIGYLRPKLIKMNDDEAVIKIRLSRRSKNHLNSMYFGALSVGADLAGGLHSFYFAKRDKLSVSVVFKSFQAKFIRRPESDVYFVCTMGQVVKAMIGEAQKTGQRINNPIVIKAYVNYLENPEEVADFLLELSIKCI